MKRDFALKPTQILKRRKLLIATNEGLIFENNRKIHFSKINREFNVPLKGIHTFLSYFSLLKRVLRLEVSSLYLLKPNVYLGITKKELFRIDIEKEEIESIKKIDRGSRPLNLCIDNNKHIYYGEYFSNNDREEVKIYVSKDYGQNWEVAFSFPAGEIRHIHGLFYDSFRSGIWILTGDSDKESGIWFTDNEFKSINKVLHGSQKYRAVSLFIQKNKLIFPMDSPLETNYILQYNFKLNETTKLSKIPNSAFHCYHQSGVYFVSTVAEPSTINDEKYSYLFASSDGNKWKEILKFEQDTFSKYSKYLFRYPEIIFVPNEETSDELFLYCRAVKKYNNYTISFSIKEIKQLI